MSAGNNLPASCEGSSQLHIEMFDRPRQPAAMSPEELECHIQDTGRLMVAAYERYEHTGCFADRGEADRWRMQMEAAIAMRKPGQVRVLEVARGLAA